MPALVARGVRKIYRGGVEALKGVDLEVREGTVTGLVGPNGAGKSTFLRVAATLLTPTEGIVIVYGKDVRKRADDIRRVISYLPEEAGTYGYLTGREYLRFFASFCEDPEEAFKRGLEIASLGDAINRKTKEYSKGMRRRLLIARTLMGRPRLAIMDEPTSGLDVLQALAVRDIIRRSVEEGSAVLLSSHNMLEVEHLCDHVYLIHEGRIVESGSPSELKERYGARSMEEVFREVVS
jgi:ABC-2 type transport system ATP-binding protein